MKSYHSDNILARNYTSSFSILSFYDIKNFYCCEASLIKRGFNCNENFILKIDILNSYFLRLKLDSHDAIINF